jgi:hypothetical protein
MMMIHHACDSIEPESVDLIFLDEPGEITDQESDNLVFAHVKNHTVPRAVVSFNASMWIAMISAVKSVNSIVDVVWCVRMDYINNDSDAKAVSSVN